MTDTITEDEILPLLLKAAPNFQSILDVLEEWEDTTPYSVAGYCAEYLLKCYRAGTTDEFAAIAELLEHLHLYGDDNVKEIATIGFLEDIQNYWGNNDVDSEIFGKLLLPESRKWWEEVQKFWRGEIDSVGESFS